MSTDKKYPLCDFFSANDVLHCASLVITPVLVNDKKGNKQFSQPSEIIDNGTITFVEYEGKTYGITCWHIIEIFRNAEKEYGEHSHRMRTMVNGFYDVFDRFVQPNPEVGQPRADIAIREISPQLLKKIGKKPINIDVFGTTPANIQHAIAIGFPTNLKYKKQVSTAFHQISMPHVCIVADLEGGLPNQRFSLFSELDEVPEVLDYSGTSGGPIFWSDEENYGIIGIIYESVAGSELLGDKVIHVSGELATPEVIVKWISDHEKRVKL